MDISSLTKFSSGLAVATAGIGLLALGTPAYAGSGATGTNIIYGSGSYGSYGDHKYKSTHKHKKHRKHKKHDKRSYYITSIGGSSATPRRVTTGRVSHTRQRYSGVSSSRPACPAGSSRAADGLCMSTRSNTSMAHTPVPHTTTSYSSRVHSASAARHTVVPFTTTVNNIANYKVPGMGANEFLSKTSCPTRVHNPEGGQVLGCYSVVKPVVQPRPIVRHQVYYQQIRVVRPVIYVHYPVPTPIAIPYAAPVQATSPCARTRYSRYGNAWPRAGGGCGSW